MGKIYTSIAYCPSLKGRSINLESSHNELMEATQIMETLTKGNCGAVITIESMLSELREAEKILESLTKGDCGVVKTREVVVREEEKTPNDVHDGVNEVTEVGKVVIGLAEVETVKECGYHEEEARADVEEEVVHCVASLDSKTICCKLEIEDAVKVNPELIAIVEKTPTFQVLEHGETTNRLGDLDVLSCYLGSPWKRLCEEEMEEPWDFEERQLLGLFGEGKQGDTSKSEHGGLNLLDYVLHSTTCYVPIIERKWEPLWVIKTQRMNIRDELVWLQATVHQVHLLGCNKLDHEVMVVCSSLLQDGSGLTKGPNHITLVFDPGGELGFRC